MRTNLTLIGNLCLSLVLLGCEEKTETLEQKANQIEEYSTSVANVFDQFAAQMKTEKVIFGHAEKNYRIGKSHLQV